MKVREPLLLVHVFEVEDRTEELFYPILFLFLINRAQIHQFFPLKVNLFNVLWQWSAKLCPASLGGNVVSSQGPLRVGPNLHLFNSSSSLIFASQLMSFFSQYRLKKMITLSPVCRKPSNAALTLPTFLIN